MRAGELDVEITLLRAAVSTDAVNAPVETWQTLATLRAKRTHTSDAERVRGAEVGGVVEVRFLIRWGPAWADLDGRDRLICDDRLHTIVGVKPTGRRRTLEISARARSEAP